MSKEGHGGNEAGEALGPCKETPREGEGQMDLPINRALHQIPLMGVTPAAWARPLHIGWFARTTKKGKSWCASHRVELAGYESGVGILVCGFEATFSSPPFIMAVSQLGDLDE